MEENSSIGFWKIAVTVLLAAVLIGMVFLIARQGKSIVNEKLEVINHALSENQSDGYMIYDNTKVSGNEVLNVIKRAVDRQECLAIRVITGMNQSGTRIQGTDYNYEFISLSEENMVTKIKDAVNQPIPNRSREITNENYVNPAGIFRGEIVRDANGILIAIVFTQEV